MFVGASKVPSVVRANAEVVADCNNVKTVGETTSMGYVGCKTIDAMKKDSQFIEITNAGMAESHVHDVMITKEAPNYQRG